MSKEELDLEEYLAWEERQMEFAFHSVRIRKRRLKFRADCGHLVDGTEPYRYTVYRVNNMPRGRIEQRTDCEFCAREDQVY
jgi:hypothetical protein